MQYWKTYLSMAALGLMMASPSFATTKASMNTQDEAVKEANVKCINCHQKENYSLVMQWKNSPHAAAQDGSVACFNCHAADEGDELAYMHEGALIKTIMTPKDCGY